MCCRSLWRKISCTVLLAENTVSFQLFIVHRLHHLFEIFVVVVVVVVVVLFERNSFFSRQFWVLLFFY